MYTPAHFGADSDASARFLAEVVAGDLVTSTDGGLVATFLPVLLDAGVASRRVVCEPGLDRGVVVDV